MHFSCCRFFVVSWILLQVEGVVVNDSRIQALLSDSSYSTPGLVFRNKNPKKPKEWPTPTICRDLITSWFRNLTELKKSNCSNEKECMDALTQLDAFARFPSPGSPNIYDGSFQKCEALNEHGSHRRKYCYVIQGDEETNCRKEYHSVLFEPNRTAFGICGPEDCHGKDYASIFGNMRRPFSFMMDRPVCAVFCTVRDIPKKNMFYVFTSFLIMLASIVFFSSLYDYIRDTRYRLSSEVEKIFGQRIILSWSVWSNIDTLFKTKHSDYIKSLDCLRTITFTWVVGQNVVAHLGFYDKEVRVDPKNFTIASSALASLIPIYTYLFMSGLTVAYTFFREKPSIEIIKRPVTWLVFYFHRWIRLTSALMVFIGFFDAYGKYIQGPYDALTGYSMVTQTDQCTYWKDIIHISNFVDVDNMCYLPAWHLAVDFQFTLVAPLFLIGFYYSSIIGTILALLAALAGSGATVYFFLNSEMLHSAFTGDHELDDNLVEIILSKPWNQLAPYMIGMTVGYFMIKYHGTKRILHPAISSTIWIIVIVLGVAAMMFGNIGESQAERAAANVVTRAVWTFCLSWIIVSSQMGWAGPIGHFLEHSFWRPFGKLTYCAFIIHHMALYFLFNMEEQAPRYISFWHEYFHYTVPIVVYSYFVAFFLYFVVEVPMLRLDTMLLGKCVPPTKAEERKESDEDDDEFDEISFSVKAEKSESSSEKSPEDQKEDDDQSVSKEDHSSDEEEVQLLDKEYY